MKSICIALLLVTLVACGSNTTSGDAADTTRSTTVGNSAGSDIIAMDTMRMDTSARSISPK